jgi:hypothetical protein
MIASVTSVTILIAWFLLAAVPAGTAAQGTASQALAQRIQVVGCVERAQRNGSLAGTGVGTTASPNTADREANSGELLDRFTLTAATPVAPVTSVTPVTPVPGERGARSAAAELTTYALEGRDAELEAHAGHRVEVTGTIAPPRSSAPRAADRAAAGAGIQRVQVESVKMVAATCAQ